ncbi:Nn.00g076030.m01.CDS01 [Neocucurbitaria sp. VM-36]
MQPLNHMPLQSRLLAYVVTTCLCLALWASFPPRHVAYAAEVPVALHHDRLSQPELDALSTGELVAIGDKEDVDSEGSDVYTPEFALLDRSLVGRQAAEVSKLTNNEKKEMDMSAGTTAYFVLERTQSRARRLANGPQEAVEARKGENVSGQATSGEEAEGVEAGEAAIDGEEHNDIRKRQAGGRVWISANTCRQPTPTGNETNPPQLVMYVSTSAQNQKPGPDSTKNLATNSSGVLFDNGYASFDVDANSDVYIGIAAPKFDAEWFGSWHFELAASTDGPYHSYNDTNPFLFMIDTDSESALFITYDLGTSNETKDVDKWREHNPFSMYAFPAGDWTPITGMERSYCALKEQFYSNSTKNFTIDTSITTRFGGDLPNSQFHVQGLDTAKTYNGFVVVEGGQEDFDIPGVGIVRGGGKVFQQFNWTTKADDSCQVLFDLEFCDSVAYAVPSSTKFKLNDTALKELYDNQARSYYQNFSRSLAQVACDTTSEAQYSLARTCKDCERDYKNWLCSVVIPRCENWSADDDWLQPRNINAAFANGTLAFDGNITREFNETHRDRFSYNQSRNPMIDELINPGPYKEMKPCEDLCFDIVRSCPAKLGFACPNSPARELSYGRRDPQGNVLMCNFPGAVVKLNVQGAADALSYSMRNVVLVASVVATLLCM